MAGEIYSFKCLQCAAPIPIHALGSSLTFVCSSCGAVVQENEQSLRVLAKASQKMLWTPLIELGSKAQFRGETWQVLGFMVRCDGPEEYFWSEYLLYNPYQGFRWLVEAQGHWNFVLMSRHQPERGSAYPGSVVWGGKAYRPFLRGVARVKFVLGEFYWRVKIGDEVTVADYVAPPDILSSEKDQSETIWSAGSYVEAEDVRKAFAIKAPMPMKQGIAPNQPSIFVERRNAYLRRWGECMVALFLLSLAMNGMKPKEGKAFQDDFILKPTEKIADHRSASFDIDPNDNPVTIKLYAPMDNAFAYVKTSLVSDDDPQSWPIAFGRELTQIDDYNDEGGLAEVSGEAFLNHISKGRYHLEIHTEIGGEAGFEGKRPIVLSVTVLQNVSIVAPLVLCMILVSLYPLWVFFAAWHFEHRRWAESGVGE